MSEYKVLVVSTEQSDRDELLDYAWAIIANAYGGDWDLATTKWKDAAEKWRDIWAELSVETEHGQEQVVGVPVKRP